MSDPFDDDVADSVEDKKTQNNTVSESKPDTEMPTETKNEVVQESKNHASSLDENSLLHEIYKQTKVDFRLDDPIIVALLSNHKFLLDAKNEFTNALKSESTKQKEVINDTLKHGLSIFDDRFSALQGTLSELDNRKDQLIAEVYAKSKINIQENIAKQFKKEVAELVKASNTTNNQTKNILLGGVIGSVIGIIFAIMFIFVLK